VYDVRRSFSASLALGGELTSAPRSAVVSLDERSSRFGRNELTQLFLRAQVKQDLSNCASFKLVVLLRMS